MQGNLRHGVDCPKAPHSRRGMLHAEDYDGPYDVDGVEYCGRCHYWLASPVESIPGVQQKVRPRLMQRAEEAISALLVVAEHGLPEIGHPGSCGPESLCDGACADAAHAARTMADARQVLADLRRALGK